MASTTKGEEQQDVEKVSSYLKFPTFSPNRIKMWFI